MHYNQQLRLALQSDARTQREIAESVGITQAQLSRYARGHDLPSARTMLSMLHTLPANYQADLVAAYIQDLLPGVEEFVLFSSKSPADHTDEPPGDYAAELPAGLTKSEREALLYLANNCHLPAVHDLLIDLHRLLEGR